MRQGDIIGSGTMVDGCPLEVTCGQGLWLLSGDLVVLEIDGIGMVTNRFGEWKRRTQNNEVPSAESPVAKSPA